MTALVLLFTTTLSPTKNSVSCWSATLFLEVFLKAGNEILGDDSSADDLRSVWDPRRLLDDFLLRSMLCKDWLNTTCEVGDVEREVPRLVPALIGFE